MLKLTLELPSDETTFTVCIAEEKLGEWGATPTQILDLFTQAVNAGKDYVDQQDANEVNAGLRFLAKSFDQFKEQPTIAEVE